MSDPVTSKSTFLCMYMKNHPDTLVAYVKHFGKVQGNVSFAEMKSIDSQGMSLSYSLKSGGVGSVHVRFDPPLSGYEEVKPRLLAMKVDAQEALGMLQSPKITSFHLPRIAMIAASFYLSMTYLSLVPPRGTSLWFIPAHEILRKTDIQPFMTRVVQFLAAFNTLGSLYTLHLCNRYVKGTFTAAAYLFSTLLCGPIIWIDLRKRIQTKRIESVMKAE